MRYLSRIFQPVITIPKNAKIKNTDITCRSQKLLLECGLIRPTSSGLLAILPLARRALDKLEKHVRTCIESAGASRVSLPCLVSASLWEQSGRLSESAEFMRLTDRHNKKYLLAPTHEESIADLIADVSPLSYKQLPILLYQITNKYRDEFRPKHGLLRSREFTMLDAYGLHTDMDCAYNIYDRVSQAYHNIFTSLGVKCYRVLAPSGEMGGSLSHEWHLPSSAGEDHLMFCPLCGSEVEGCTCGGTKEIVNSIEVGHTFILGTRYSEPLKATFVGATSSAVPLVMSCYGVGVTRLLAACIEHLSSDTSIRWPTSIAPYKAIIVGPKEGSKEWRTHNMEKLNSICDRLSVLPSLENDVLIDDRHNMTIGKRMVMAEKMGYPYIIVCGRNSLENPPKYELHATNGQTNTPTLLTLEEIVDLIENQNGENQIIKIFN